MKHGLLYEIEDYTKFPELVGLWNKWQKVSMLLSTGNFNVQEWKNMVEYIKEHPKEGAEFIYDYLEDLGSNWMILSVFDSAFGCPIETKEDKIYIDPHLDSVIRLYKEKCLQIKGVEV